MRYNFCKFTKNIEFTNSFQKFKTFRIIDLKGHPVSNLHKELDHKLLN